MGVNNSILQISSHDELIARRFDPKETIVRGGSLYVPGRIGPRMWFHDPLNGETRQRLNCNWWPSTDTCTKQLVITLQTTLP